MEVGLKKKKKRRARRAGIRVQERRKKALLALQEIKDQQQLIESTRNETQRVEDQDKIISSLNDSVKNSLQCENNCQSPADPMQLSPKQLNLPQKSEKTVDLLQLETNLSVSQAQQSSPVQVKNDRNTTQLDRNENMSLHDSIKDKLQSVENSQPSADFMLSSPLEQQNLPQNSEKKVNLLQSLEQKSFLLLQRCLPMQIKNKEAEKLDHLNGNVSSLNNSIKNQQSEENSQPSVDFMESSSVEQQKLPQSSKEKVEISQTQESSLSCQNTEKVTNTVVKEEEEPSSRTNIKLLLLKQEKLFIQHKNRIEQFQLQDTIISHFHKYIKLCSNHEDKVFKLKQKLIEYELQIARENERLKKK